MQTAVPYLRIEQEQSSRLTLISSDRRWLIMFISVFFTAPLVLLGFCLLSVNFWVLSIILMSFGLCILILPLLFSPWCSHVVIDSNSRVITLSRKYWLGVGTLGHTRGKSWKMDDITNINIMSAGFFKRIEIELNGKKELFLVFGFKSHNDAQRSCNVLQSWLKDLPLDTPETITDSDGQEDNKNKSQQALRSAKKMLYFFGAFNLFGGVLGLSTDRILTSSITPYTVISIFTGLVYLACGYGAKHRSEIALWIAILVILAERLYGFIMTKLLGGGGTLWSSFFIWIFAFFVVSILWAAIQSIRSMKNDPTFNPPA